MILFAGDSGHPPCSGCFRKKHTNSSSSVDLVFRFPGQTGCLGEELKDNTLNRAGPVFGQPAPSLYG